MLNGFVFNGVELHADFSDLKVMESYEQAMEVLVNSDKSFTKASESIRHECTCINRAFDSIFGEGSADKLFDGRMNRDISYAALYALHDHVAKSQILSNERIKEMAAKYQHKK